MPSVVSVPLTVNVSSPCPNNTLATSTSLNVMPRRKVVLTGLPSKSLPVTSVRLSARPRPQTLVVCTVAWLIGSTSSVLSISPMSFDTLPSLRMLIRSIAVASSIVVMPPGKAVSVSRGSVTASTSVRLAVPRLPLM